MKKLLVMGSNFGSMEIVQRAKERGLYTIVTDYYDSSRSNAKLYCDECWEISTTETEKLAQKCIEEHVDAVTCGVSEFTSELTFKLCDRLNLPKYGSWEAWNIARDKRRFKDLCIRNGVPVADDYRITDPFDPEQIKGIRYPVVVKPVDCGGNEGVSFCDNPEELQKAFLHAQEVSEHKDTIICERRLKGVGFAAGYALAEGEASLIDLYAWHSEDGEPKNVYSLNVTASGRLDQYNREVDPGIRKVFHEAGFVDGYVWIEMMSDTDGHLYVLEPGYRLAGGMLPYTFAEVAGFNVIDWYLDAFLGIRHTKEDLPKPQTEEYSRYGVSYCLWNREGGKIREVNGLEKLRDISKSAIVDFIRKPGYELHPFSMLGEVLFTAADRQEAIDTIRRINESVSVINEDGKNVLIYFTNFGKIK